MLVPTLVVTPAPARGGAVRRGAWGGALVSTPGLLPVLALVLALASAAPAASWRVTVRAKGDAPGETPVVAPVRADVPPGGYALRPADRGDAAPLRAQVFERGGGRFLAAVLAGLRSGAETTYVMNPVPPASDEKAGVRFREEGPGLAVLLEGEVLTVDRTDPPNKPYFYPVIGPTGAPITRAFPMKTDVPGEDRDHNHQRSFWFTHGDVNGVDFWASDPLNPAKPNYGTIAETSRKVVTAGPAVGILHTTDAWRGPDGKTVCEDEREYSFYKTAAARVIDVDVTIKATAGPVTFGDTKEGMFGLRVASSMDVKNKKGGKITNAEGLTDDAAWGKASPWVDYTGPVEGKTVGVAILNHPDSFRYPTTWHVRTYGLFAANPFGWHDFGLKKSGAHTVQPGGSMRFRYRVLLHPGDTPSAHIAEAFRAYAEPPSVEVRGDGEAGRP